MTVENNHRHKPPPFTYQIYTRDKIHQRPHTVVVAPPGAGKTRPVIEAIQKWQHTGITLVFCSGNAIATWVKQLPLWGDPDAEVAVVSGMSAHKRKQFWLRCREGEFHGYIIGNYALLRNDFDTIVGPLSGGSSHINGVICDEYHKAFRRHQSKTFQCLKRLARRCHFVIPISGTALGKHPGTLWTGFHVCNPRVFGSYWKFVDTYCLVDDEGAGKRILGPRPSSLEALKGMMNHYFVYVPEEVVADQLPQGKRNVIPVNMTVEQYRIYNELKEEMVAMIGNELVMTPNALALQNKLRQLLCCPQIVDPSLGLGRGYETIAELIANDDEDHTLVFTPFRAAVPVIKDALAAEGHTTYMLRGGMDHEEVQKTINAFRITGGVLVGTIQFAESWDAEKCATTYFLGYVHNTDQLTQAEGRTRRAISDHKFVKWNYIQYVGTYDEDALDGIEQDFHNMRKVLKRPDAFIEALKGQNKGE